MFLIIQFIQRILLISLLCLSFVTQSMAGLVMSCDDMNEMSMQADMKTGVITSQLSMQHMSETMLHGENKLKMFCSDKNVEQGNQQCNQCVCVLMSCSSPALTHQLSPHEPILLLLSRLPSITTPILASVTSSVYKPPIS
ncbi:hypothetical protein [Shewanella surugensis]|uniref:DUF2946 domain-containing protein n=1 Tax=Shewanella surugensis TaxID=212020 RepID=A0ABT0L851_9GAMM|nr:hypothetical protein [Shewanella surugensis]MCL1123351.1 hypothetical protein [Shewanella surugensis]